jgi:hypothetical protein
MKWEAERRHTPAFETRLVASDSGEVVPYPSEHLLTLLNAREGRRIYSL